MTNRSLCLFALNATAALGSAVAADLSLPLAAHEEREFEDGEHKTRPCRAARHAGAKRVVALVTHGLFMPGAESVLLERAIDRLVVTDSASTSLGEATRAKTDVLTVAPLLAECIRRLHAGNTLNDLLVF